ncbi:MAG: hypothetical protein LBJ20_04140 [Candidatus Methanoplasma sp.]|jgi:hypothetical protein|nr:hypothetical protein [Candidatus Methanoplasma sp.]
MASEKKNTVKDSSKGYQPKATARHAKMTRTKQEEIDAFKKKIDTDKYLSKKYESDRKTEIKELPKDERAAAKAELKESIERRKETEYKDRMKLRMMHHEGRVSRVKQKQEPFDEEAWLKNGRKKDRNKPTDKKSAAAPEEDASLADGRSDIDPTEDQIPDSDAPENIGEESAPEGSDEKY